jgi:hypothetical protein
MTQAPQKGMYYVIADQRRCRRWHKYVVMEEFRLLTFEQLRSVLLRLVTTWVVALTLALGLGQVVRRASRVCLRSMTMM